MRRRRVASLGRRTRLGVIVPESRGGRKRRLRRPPGWRRATRSVRRSRAAPSTILSCGDRLPGRGPHAHPRHSREDGIDRLAHRQRLYRFLQDNLLGGGGGHRYRPRWQAGGRLRLQLQWPLWAGRADARAFHPAAARGRPRYPDRREARSRPSSAAIIRTRSRPARTCSRTRMRAICCAMAVCGPIATGCNSTARSPTGWSNTSARSTC